MPTLPVCVRGVCEGGGVCVGCSVCEECVWRGEEEGVRGRMERKEKEKGEKQGDERKEEGEGRGGKGERNLLTCSEHFDLNHTPV